MAFKFAVDTVNKDLDLLPKTSLEYTIDYVRKSDSFQAMKTGS